MSGRAKGAKVKSKSKSRLSCAELQFPVGRIHRLLRKGNYTSLLGCSIGILERRNARAGWKCSP